MTRTISILTLIATGRLFAADKPFDVVEAGITEMRTASPPMNSPSPI
jgi:hypothetical protein